MKLSRIVLFCEDLERSISFYKETLALPPVEERTGWASFMPGEIEIALHQGKGRSPRFEYNVSDLASSREQLIARKWKVGEIKSINDRSYFEGKDRDGNTIRVIEG